MIVRKVRSSEIKRVQELSAIAFEYSMDNSKTPEQLFDEKVSNPQSRLDANWQCQWGAFEDDGTTLMSGFAVIPYTVHFDGHPAAMAGIGGVATLPPYRRRGGVRACFEAALPDMYANGCIFSYLYPFSTAYYRKFGYELCYRRQRYKLLLDKIPSVPLLGRCHLVEQENPMLGDIRQVYQAWQNRYNMMVIAEDFEFAWVCKSNPFQDQRYTYIYKAQDGQPKAYTTFQKVDDPDGRNLRCSRFFFIDVEGFYGLMNLLVSLAADHRFVIFDAPMDQEILPLLPEWSLGAGQCEMESWGMARVVNVEQALRMATARGEGSLVLAISDPQIPQNNGRFEVTFAQGVENRVEKTHKEPDVTMTIQEFSRLILGVYEIESLPFLAAVAVHTDPRRLSPLFYRKPICITEYF